MIGHKIVSRFLRIAKVFNFFIAKKLPAINIRLISFFCVFLLTFSDSAISNNVYWGFYAHKRINRMAVFTLPPEMFVFYKYFIGYITENAVNPDKRRYAVPDEAPRHYIDIDVYGVEAIETFPRYWDSAVAKYTEDTLKAYGVLPWNILKYKYMLTKAFKEKDPEAILRLSSDLGHYIGDATVPLHTTLNYNGQLSGQEGIHGFWESRLPELFAEEYNFFVGKASYIDNTNDRVWEIVKGSHYALDSVFTYEKELTEKFDPDKKYSFEERGAQNATVKVYSYEFSKTYHNKLNGQVERRMRTAIKNIGDFWMTCWIDAGQPHLGDFINSERQKEIEQELAEERKDLIKKDIDTRIHEGF